MSAAGDPLSLLGAGWVAERARLGQRFREAAPFPHLIIDGFLREDACRALLDQFPSFERGHNVDENGNRGGKAVCEQLPALGAPFAALDELVRSPAFLTLLGELVGVERLVYDPAYLGGGTHENRAGQNLNFHVDFNRHPRGWDRRLNLLLYLNPEWQESWGGCLELRADPRVPAPPVLPLFNRAVLFETSERSWHGFEEIRAPAGHSRRSLAFYFYTEELRDAPPHSTVYIEPPYTDRDLTRAHHFVTRRVDHAERLLRRELQLFREIRDMLGNWPPGATATDAQLGDVAAPFALLDELLASLYEREPRLLAARDRIRALATSTVVEGPLQAVASDGLWHDRWAGARLTIRGRATAPISSLIVRGRVAPETPEQTLTVGEERRTFAPGSFEWEVPFSHPAGALELVITAEQTFNPHQLGKSDDRRQLAWLVHPLEAR